MSTPNHAQTSITVRAVELSPSPVMMKRSISQNQFILLFSYVIFISQTLAEPSEATSEPSEAMKTWFLASRQRYHKARLSAPNRNTLVADEQDFHWSGAYQTNPPQYSTFDAVTATWIVSSISLPQGATGKGQWGFAEWVGIDGQETCPGALFQAGLLYWITTDDTGAVVDRQTKAFYEWLPAEAVITDFPVAEGDMFKVLVEGTTPSDGVVVFQNPVTGVEKVITVSAPDPDSHLCGGYVEWIVELPVGTPQNYELAAFGKVLLQNCYGHRIHGPAVNLVGATLIDLIDNNGKILAKSQLESDTLLSVEYILPKP